MSEATTDIDLDAFVARKVIEGADALRQRFQGARPFRHLVIDDFLEGDFCRGLLEQFPAFDEQLAINENGEVGGKAVHERVGELGGHYAAMDDLVRSAGFRGLIERMTGIPDLLYDEYYFGGGTHENRHGQDLDPHVDFNYHPITRWHRRMNLIIYLNEEWDSAWGGAIDLHRDPRRKPAQDEIVSVAPRLNRCVIFETNEISWHGFRRIDLPEDRRDVSRKSFALYYYTKDRPAEETAEEHSTIYVERHLPERIRPGLTLSEQDWQEIRILLARRDQHLKRLYDNITHLQSQLNVLRGRGRPSTDVEALGEDAGGLRRELELAEAEIDLLRNSTSWRVTAPLRAMGRRVKRLLGRPG